VLWRPACSSPLRRSPGRHGSARPAGSPELVVRPSASVRDRDGTGRTTACRSDTLTSSAISSKAERFCPSSVSYVRCCNRPVATTRLPLRRAFDNVFRRAAPDRASEEEGLTVTPFSGGAVLHPACGCDCEVGDRNAGPGEPQLRVGRQVAGHGHYRLVAHGGSKGVGRQAGAFPPTVSRSLARTLAPTRDVAGCSGQPNSSESQCCGLPLRRRAAHRLACWRWRCDAPRPALPGTALPRRGQGRRPRGATVSGCPRPCPPPCSDALHRAQLRRRGGRRARYEGVIIEQRYC
jgi:hypothetical protein